MRHHNADHAALELQVAARLAAAWDCQVHAFPPFTPIDYYCARAGAVIGYAELKCFGVPAGQYGQVFLSLRKWLALQMAWLATGIGGRYVVRWADDVVTWIAVRDVDARELSLDGVRGNGYGREGLEPIIHIPFWDMTPLGDR